MQQTLRGRSGRDGFAACALRAVAALGSSLVAFGACSEDVSTSSGPGHAHQDPLAHCKPGHVMKADPRDQQISSVPQTVVARAGDPARSDDDVHDVILPDAVSDWMYEQGWQQQHDDWHNIRRWDQGCRTSNASASACSSAKRLADRGLWRAPIQEGAPGDGYDFLVMHRHMLQMLRAAFPKNAALFDGFRRIPRSKTDPDNPNPDVQVRWTTNQLVAIEKLENIETHVGEFATEDDLALYMEAPFRWTAANPSVNHADPSSGLHFGLHAQWSIQGSPALLGNGPTTVDNFVFWKLHGWLDDVWERYRKAKGITAQDPKYVAALQAQCEEMYALDDRNLKPAGLAPSDGGAGAERGVFAEQVRPIFEAKCTTCHGPVGQSAALTLGGSGVSSAEVVAGLVNVKSTNGEYGLVVPRDPARSWLFLKATGDAATASCSGSCNRGPMPPAGEALTPSELAVLKSWIEAGAPEGEVNP